MSTNLIPRAIKRQKKFENILKSFFPDTELESSNKNDEFFDTIEKARQELQDAQNFFDNVAEPELIDHAIYRMEAAKTKYVFLIKTAKSKGLKVEI